MSAYEDITPNISHSHFDVVARIRIFWTDSESSETLAEHVTSSGCVAFRECEDGFIYLIPL